MLKVDNISKKYDSKNYILKNINFEVNKGEFVVLVGPSGCGKSTILKMIAGLEDITDGTLYINDKIANNLQPKDRELSMVFQNYALYPHMTVEKNILFTLEMRKVPKVERQQRMMNAAEIVGLQDYLKKKPGELSGGQRQRVALARAIVSESNICLMDEPLSNLDAKLRGQMRLEIRELQQRLNMTMIYVTHDQVEAMTMGDRIVILNEGEIQQIGTPLEIYNNPNNRFVANFMGSPAMNIVNFNIDNDDLELQKLTGFNFSNQRFNQIDIGFRPEHIILDESGIEVTVISQEMLGDVTMVKFELNNTICMIKFFEQMSFEQGEVIRVKIIKDKVFFFESVSGNRIEI